MTMPAIARRRLLSAIAAGAGAVALGPQRVDGEPVPTDQRLPRSGSPQNFGRMFGLPPFADDSEAVRAALTDLGRAGGLLDAHDELGAGPERLITDPALSLNNPNNAAATAGITFLGQFIDHDVTFDASSRLGMATVPSQTRNLRTCLLDLDCVYGAGPVADRRLYDPADRLKFRVESGGLFEDLPRTATMEAVVADPRNDENLIVAALHCAFLLFHNRAVDEVRAAGAHTDPADVFAAARRLTTWHYHWLVLHEFLPVIVGRATLDDMRAEGRRHFTAGVGEAFMPVEFQTGVYRMGHSMVRPSYRANLAGDAGAPFFAVVFDPACDGQSDADDLRGGHRAPRRFVGWQTFFDFGDGEVKPNKAIDTRISTPLFNLPIGAIATHDAPTSLPQRNLLRHLTWELPSGQAIAAELGAEPLSGADLDELSGFGVGFERSTPLWYYVLKEAELVAGGSHLGPVGGRIAAEVLTGLLHADPDSYVNAQPDWRPTLPAAGEAFRMTDFLTFAGVDPGTRGQ
jgi:hypothetical protein